MLKTLNINNEEVLVKDKFLLNNINYDEIVSKIFKILAIEKKLKIKENKHLDNDIFKNIETKIFDLCVIKNKIVKYYECKIKGKEIVKLNKSIFKIMNNNYFISDKSEFIIIEKNELWDNDKLKEFKFRLETQDLNKKKILLFYSNSLEDLKNLKSYLLIKSRSFRFTDIKSQLQNIFFNNKVTFYELFMELGVERFRDIKINSLLKIKKNKLNFKIEKELHNIQNNDLVNVKFYINKLFQNEEFEINDPKILLNFETLDIDFKLIYKNKEIKEKIFKISNIKSNILLKNDNVILYDIDFINIIFNKKYSLTSFMLIKIYDDKFKKIIFNKSISFNKLLNLNKSLLVLKSSSSNKISKNKVLISKDNLLDNIDFNNYLNSVIDKKTNLKDNILKNVTNWNLVQTNYKITKIYLNFKEKLIDIIDKIMENNNFNKEYYINNEVFINDNSLINFLYINKFKVIKNQFSIVTKSFLYIKLFINYYLKDEYSELYKKFKLIDYIIFSQLVNNFSDILKSINLCFIFNTLAENKENKEYIISSIFCLILYFNKNKLINNNLEDNDYFSLNDFLSKILNFSLMDLNINTVNSLIENFKYEPGILENIKNKLTFSSNFIPNILIQDIEKNNIQQIKDNYNTMISVMYLKNISINLLNNFDFEKFKNYNWYLKINFDDNEIKIEDLEEYYYEYEFEINGNIKTISNNNFIQFNLLNLNNYIFIKIFKIIKDYDKKLKLNLISSDEIKTVYFETKLPILIFNHDKYDTIFLQKNIKLSYFILDNKPNSNISKTIDYYELYVNKIENKFYYFSEFQKTLIKEKYFSNFFDFLNLNKDCKLKPNIYNNLFNNKNIFTFFNLKHSEIKAYFNFKNEYLSSVSMLNILKMKIFFILTKTSSSISNWNLLYDTFCEIFNIEELPVNILILIGKIIYEYFNIEISEKKIEKLFINNFNKISFNLLVIDTNSANLKITHDLSYYFYEILDIFNNLFYENILPIKDTNNNLFFIKLLIEIINNYNSTLNIKLSLKNILLIKLDEETLYRLEFDENYRIEDNYDNFLNLNYNNKLFITKPEFLSILKENYIVRNLVESLNYFNIK